MIFLKISFLLIPSLSEHVNVHGREAGDVDQPHQHRQQGEGEREVHRVGQAHGVDPRLCNNITILTNIVNYVFVEISFKIKKLANH